jgi:hypothetical protein
MSIQFQLRNWRFNVTWEGLECAPLDDGERETALRPAGFEQHAAAFRYEPAFIHTQPPQRSLNEHEPDRTTRRPTD